MKIEQRHAAAMTFRLLMERTDNAPQGSGMILPRNGAAMSDWGAFARRLSSEFFNRMQQIAETHELINIPPRRRLNVNGAAQWGEPSQPITTTEDLFMRGVCQVRHNIVHGNKLDLDERDMKLIAGATAVLRAAIVDTKIIEL